MISKKEENIINSRGMEAWRESGKKRIGLIICEQLDISGYGKDEVFDIINNISNFKYLCYNCSLEKIVASICLFIKKVLNEKFNIEKSSIFIEYELSISNFITIISRITNYYQNKYIFNIYSEIVKEYSKDKSNFYIKEDYKKFNTNFIKNFNNDFEKEDIISWIKLETKDSDIFKNVNKNCFDKILKAYLIKINSSLSFKQICLIYENDLNIEDYLNILCKLYKFFKGNMLFHDNFI